MSSSWLGSTAYLQGLRQEEAGAFAAAAGRMPQELSNWLARLRLLYGVPFHYLVPDARLLPVESIRFFYIDRNFTDRLVDGALSVGKTTTREFAQAQSAHTTVKTRVDDEERVLRNQLRRAPVLKIVAPRAADLTGLLLRSRAVSGWPGLEVKAYRDLRSQNGEGRRLPLLRMDRLAPDVLLCLFEGVPQRVDIEEPREGIQFGIDPKDANGDGIVEPSTAVPSGFTVKLRYLRAGAGQQAGEAILDNDRAVSVPVPVRRGNRRVVHVRALRDALKQALENRPEAHADPQGTLGSAELALQMFQPPFRQRFEGEGRQRTTTSQYADAVLKVSVMAEALKRDELKTLFPLADFD
ncbi:MAG: hypothetical protein JNJ71_09705 [Rubrivivax sp.]|nr:hypothetical protein [Rubrivivax sp.]